MDVNGNDNQPEWGYCTAPGCHDAAFPIWLAGEYPDDPDLLLCETHIGAEIARLRDVLDAARCVITHKNRNECLRIDNAIIIYDAGTKASRP